MPLPTPNLDDRRFQDIVDAAKSLIPHYCPEWTDHNVSDPGVTLIELFAWMTDMLLYRVNQVPDKVYVKFLDLIGVRLEPPRSARVPVTLYLSAPQPDSVTIPEGTEVATVQTETSPAIVFTTEAALTILPPEVVGALTGSRDAGGSPQWKRHDLRQLALPGQQIALFPEQPAPDDAFYLALRHDHSYHVLAVVLDCEVAGGAGIDPTRPPVEWEVWQGGTARWAPCRVEYDGTHGFNDPGEIILHTPIMAEGEIADSRAYWLRCRLTDAQAGPTSYRVSPDVNALRVEARGGTANARHATTITDEQLGVSDGTPGQSFRLLHTPVLARDPERDVLVVEPPGGEQERWTEVSDFADSGPDDRHFTLDGLDGSITLGPSLLQPDGSVYGFGSIPPKGSALLFSRYQFGGGVEGNVSRDAITVLKTSIPYIARTTNSEPATGGRDAQSLEDAKVRAPRSLRTRSRAVTADDYECLATEVPGVARAACLAPGSQPGAPTDPRPGQVFVIALPETDVPDGPLTAEGLTLQPELREAVLGRLNALRPLGIAVEVREPQYVWVSIDATIRLAQYSTPEFAAEVQRYAQAQLFRYLNPYLGGPDGTGWPFGRTLYVSEIYGLLQQIRSVQAVEDVRISVHESAHVDEAREAGATLAIPRHALICSRQHSVRAHTGQEAAHHG